MFFCNKCAKANEWPNSIFKSYGKCEMCNNSAECNDVPSKHLPNPKPAPVKEYKAKHRAKD